MVGKIGLSKETRLILSVLTVYVLFIKWGYLQEKITSKEYLSDGSNTTPMFWSYPFALNFVMALASVTIAGITEVLFTYFSTTPQSEFTQPLKQQIHKEFAPFQAYWKAALSNTIASPIGYASLRYISFPLMILTKSSKPVPVILIGVFYYGKKYKWYKYLSVALICIGIALFSSAKKASSNTNDSLPIPTQDLSIGIILVLTNLLLDGYTNNEQDLIFSKYESSSLQLMKFINSWQVIYLGIILLFTFLVQQSQSELFLALAMLSNSKQLRYDLFEFCLCAGIGQILIFQIMKDFGSLAWVTISVTRKLFTILVSVIMFSHPVNEIQWLGVIGVFVGMSIDMYLGSVDKKSPSITERKEKQQ